jgi:hypothetical protein
LDPTGERGVRWSWCAGFLEPELSTGGDGGVGCRVCNEERVERVDDPSESFAVEREPPGNTDEAVCDLATPERLGEQRPEVSEVSGYDDALLVRLRCKMHSVWPSTEVRAFANRDDVMPAAAELSGDLG